MFSVLTTPEGFENGGFTLRKHQLFSVHTEEFEKRIKSFPSTLRRRNLKTQQSPVILDLCLRKTRSGKSYDYHDVIVFEKLRFQNIFRAKTKSRLFRIPPV